MPPPLWNEPLARLLDSRSIHAVNFQALNQTRRHCQPGFELNLTCQGQGTLHVGGETFAVCAETLVFIPEPTVHQLEVHTPGRYRRSVLCVAPPARDTGPLAEALRALLRQRPFSKPRCFQLDAETTHRVRSRIARIAAEMQEQAGWWKEMVLAQTCELLALAARIAALPPRPTQARPSSLADTVAAYVAAHLDEDLSAEALARHCGVSREHFSRTFPKLFGVTYRQYVLNRRLETARRLLADPQAASPILDIALAAGFQSHAHFSRVFRRHMGVTPAQYRALHRVGT